MYYPLMIDLEQMNVVIVGGGKIAYRKFSNIVDYSKIIKVISPEFCDNFNEYFINYEDAEDKKGIEFIAREVKLSDIENSNIVFLATGNRELNEELSEFCKSRKILVNSVDNHNNSSFINMGTFRADSCIEGAEEVMIGISLFGKNPKLLKVIKEKIKRTIKNNTL